jgi:hypothetical protein
MYSNHNTFCQKCQEFKQNGRKFLRLDKGMADLLRGKKREKKRLAHTE